jgi:AMMECR1 domain-containing protein
MTTKWTKYSFVCTECDSLIEYTCNEYGLPTGSVNNITCICGGWTVQTAVVDATILPTTTEEETMETTEYLKAQIQVLQDTLKSHNNCDYWKSENGRIGRQIIDLINDSYDNGNDAEDILTSLCQIVDYNPTKEISFTATMSFSGTIQVSREDQDDFDLSDILGEAYVDINHGDVVIDSYELYDAEEC